MGTVITGTFMQAVHCICKMIFCYCLRIHVCVTYKCYLVIVLLRMCNVLRVYVFIFECEGVHACMCVRVCCMSVRGDVFPFVVHIVYVFTTSALK